MEQIKLSNRKTIVKDIHESSVPSNSNNQGSIHTKQIVRQKQALEIQQIREKHSKSLQKSKLDCDDLTKKRDESYLINQEIAVVKSGKFKPNKKQQQQQLHSKRQPQELHLPEEAFKSVEKKITQNSHKINKTLGSHFKDVQKHFAQMLKEVLATNKSIRTVFNHFCKQNNLTSIKSTLFDDKIKTMQEMSLNKWMVFCKQFEIYSKLCRIRSHNKQALQVQDTKSLSILQPREKHLVRQAKQVQKRLMNVFKTASNNASKMNFQAFIIAICDIYYQFKPQYIQDEKGIVQFLCEVMYCQKQKSCLKKLSSLKFTFATPRISYNKVCFRKGKIISRLKTISTSKENIESSFKRQNSFVNKNKVSEHLGRLGLNPILYQAKRVIQDSGMYAKKAKCSQSCLTKMKLKDITNLKQKKIQKQLVDYFQSSKDPILSRYFQVETGKAGLQLCKKK